MRRILVTGTPLVLNELLWSIGTTMVNQSYSTRGLTVVAATNITNTAWNLFCVIMFAMGNAVSILIGQKLGAGEIEEAKRTDNKLLFFTVALHVFIGVLIALCAPFIPLIYNTEPAVRTLTTQLLLVAGAALPLQLAAHVTYFTIRSGGKTFITFLFDCLYTWVVPLPIAFCLCRFTDLPVVWVYFCVQFADIVKVIIGVCLLRSGIWPKTSSTTRPPRSRRNSRCGRHTGEGDKTHGTEKNRTHQFSRAQGEDRGADAGGKARAAGAARRIHRGVPAEPAGAARQHGARDETATSAR